MKHTCNLDHHGGANGLTKLTVDSISRNFTVQYEDGTFVFGTLDECGPAAVTDKLWRHVTHAFENRKEQPDEPSTSS